MNHILQKSLDCWEQWRKTARVRKPLTLRSLTMAIKLEMVDTPDLMQLVSIPRRYPTQMGAVLVLEGLQLMKVLLEWILFDKI